MKKNRFLPLMLLCATLPGTVDCYQPIRYEQFLIHSTAALEAQRKLIEQKLHDLRSRQRSTLGADRDSHLTRRKSRIAEELLLATDITQHTLESRLTSVKRRLTGLAEEKKKLSTLQVADRNAETELLRKAAARETMSDIQDQLQDIDRMDTYFTQMPSGEIDPASLRELRSKWSKQRTELAKKLSREQTSAR
jgi:hypothetical protein